MPANPVDPFHTVRGATSGQWEIGPVRRRMHRIAPLVAVVVGVAGPVIMLSGQQRPSIAFAAVWLVFWLAVCARIVVLFLREVTRIVVTPDGGIEAHRIAGSVRTHANRVSRIGHAWWVSGNHSSRPAKICTADGDLRLAQGFPNVFDVATAVRAHNPTVPVEL